jgi:hypothetical protein
LYDEVKRTGHWASLKAKAEEQMHLNFGKKNHQCKECKEKTSPLKILYSKIKKVSAPATRGQTPDTIILHFFK